MIKFEAINVETHGRIGEGVAIGNNSMNNVLATRLKASIGDGACEDHPDFENKVEVRVQDENKFKITRVCCNKFREKLIVALRHPDSAEDCP